MDDFYWMDQNEASRPWRVANDEYPWSHQQFNFGYDPTFFDQAFDDQQHTFQSSVYTPGFNVFEPLVEARGTEFDTSIASANDLVPFYPFNNLDVEPLSGLVDDNGVAQSLHNISPSNWGVSSRSLGDFIGEFENQANSLDEAPHNKMTEQIAQYHDTAKEKVYTCNQCEVTATSPVLIQSHRKTHGHLCHECKTPFGNHFDINNHARETGHNAYQCTECDATFSRLDVLGRHRQDHRSVVEKYSCTHCKKWRAPNGFTRKDHLTQHLRNYHHLQIDNSESQQWGWNNDVTDPGFFNYCFHKGCSLFREDSVETRSWGFRPLFASRSAFTSHMKKEHDESVFQCTHTGCPRINGKGFFRKRDLMKHMRKEHVVYGASDDDEACISQASAGQQEISPGIVHTSGEASAVANAQEESQSQFNIDINTKGDIEAALKVLRSKGYLVEKNPNFSATSTK